MSRKRRNKRQSKQQSTPVVNADGLQNVVTGLGTSKSKRSHNVWQYDLLSGYQQLDAAYQTNWIARQIVDVPAQDMTREWRRIYSNQAEEIENAERTLCMRSRVQDAVAWARLYGGAGVLMVTNQDLTKPLDVNKIGKGDLKKLIVFDRWEMGATTMNTYNILSDNFLQPEFYNIQGGDNTIHWSHFARFYGEKLPRRQMQQAQGWGDSTLRKCMQDIEDLVAANGGIAELMQEANVDVIKREGLADALASDQDSAIIKKYELFSMMKSNIQLALLDGEEDFERKTLSLSGVAPIIELFMTWISGASRIPLTKLFGTSAKGLNATGEGDLKTYYDDVRSMQSANEQAIQTIDEVMVRSATGSMPDDYNYVWNPLQQADIVETAQAELLKAQTDTIYLGNNVITRSQIQRQLQSDESYQFDEDKINELEELEEANIFEEPLDITMPDKQQAATNGDTGNE